MEGASRFNRGVDTTPVRSGEEPRFSEHRSASAFCPMMNLLLPLAAVNDVGGTVRAMLPYVALGLLALFASFGVLWLRKEWRSVATAAEGLLRWLAWRHPAAPVGSAAVPATDQAKSSPDESNRDHDPVLIAVIAAAASVYLEEGERIVAIHPEGCPAEYTRHLWAWPAEGRRELASSRERLQVEPRVDRRGHELVEVVR